VPAVPTLQKPEVEARVSLDQRKEGFASCSVHELDVFRCAL